MTRRDRPSPQDPNEGAATRPDSGDETEREATLLVCSDAPATVANEIAALSALDGYVLRAGAEHAIHDLYFDLPDGALRARRVALRARSMDGKDLLTLKGPGRTISDGALERLEAEAVWSAATLDRVRALLEGYGVELPESAGAVEARRPREVLEAAGLSVIQERRVRRRTAHVLAPDATETSPSPNSPWTRSTSASPKARSVSTRSKSRR